MQWNNLNTKAQANNQFKVRIVFSVFIVLLCFSILLVRFVYLQVVYHEAYTTASDENRHKLQPLAPVRGMIFDTEGSVLAGNRAIHNLTIIPEEIKKSGQTLDSVLNELSQLVNISAKDIDSFKLRMKQSRRPFSSIPLYYQLSEEAIARVTVHQHRLPGVQVEADLVRYYPYDYGFVHALGYVGRINNFEMANVDKTNYSATHYIGKLGIEKFYENTLHGKVGYQKVETNSKGRILKVLDQSLPEPGKDITLFLDADLQTKAIELLAGKRGAIVALDPKTGGVLALVSMPSYEANQFVTGISLADYETLRQSKELPLFNRALSGRYPPASTIKPIIALAALDSGISPYYTIDDPGYYQLSEGGRLYRDWLPGGHGRVNLHKSIVESVDTYYYNLGHRLGNEPMTEFLGKFGFGKVTIADQPDSIGAVLPTKEWKRVYREMPWFPGDSLNLSIGQGFLSATPIQLATMTMLLANKGQWHQIRMIKQLEDTPIDKVSQTQTNIEDPHLPEDIKLKRTQDWDLLHDAMIDVMHSVKGTARESGAGSVYKIAGKTGTAQILGIKQDEEYDAQIIEERLRDHGLFVGWAPAHDPQIVLAVVVENGDSGSRSAAPIARQLMDAYILRDEPTQSEPSAHTQLAMTEPTALTDG